MPCINWTTTLAKTRARNDVVPHVGQSSNQMARICLGVNIIGVNITDVWIGMIAHLTRKANTNTRSCKFDKQTSLTD